MSIIVGIDPAPAESGMAVINSEEESLEFTNFSTIPARGSFDNWFVRSYEMSEKIFAQLRDVYKIVPYSTDLFIIMETPPPISRFSAALYGLDFLILDFLGKGYLANVITVVLVGPTYCQHLVGKRCDKKYIGSIVKQLLSDNKFFITQEERKRTTHEDDAGLLALYAYHNLAKNILIPGIPSYVDLDKWGMNCLSQESEFIGSKFTQQTKVKLYTQRGS